MTSLPPGPHREHGSVRVALLCVVAGAVAVFVWNGLTPRDAPGATPPPASAASSESQRVPLPAGRTGVQQALPTPPSTVTGPSASAADAAGASPESSVLDADGFSPDYGALVDGFQQQRALEPLIDD